MALQSCAPNGGNALQGRIVADFPFGIDARLFQVELTFDSTARF